MTRGQVTASKRNPNSVSVCAIVATHVPLELPPDKGIAPIDLGLSAWRESAENENQQSKFCSMAITVHWGAEHTQSPKKNQRSSIN